MSPSFSAATLSASDAKAIASIRSVIDTAPTNENFVEVTYGEESATAVIEGTTPGYLPIMNFTLADGDFISDRNVGTRDDVIVLGSKIADDLFGDKDPVGQKVKLKGRQFTVIGVLAPKGGAFFGFSMDGIVVVPITTFQTRLFAQQTASGEDAVQSVSVKVASADVIEDVRQEIKDLLRRRHRLTADEKDDFAVYTQEQALGVAQQVTGIFTVVLGAIASISLIVGGIGIMNIMLVSVTERTREIGIRKAVGAKRRDILLQFLLEAATLSLTGGAIGIAGGWLAAKAISSIQTTGITLTAVVTPDIVILAASVSIAIGLVAGVYPAMRAARLNPIDALRYE
jgi:putative ABC transport system permease protein